MDRRSFIPTSAGGISTLPSCSSHAQERPRLVRIGMISTSFDQRADGIQAFKTKLKSLGYIEGDNLIIDICDGGGRNDLAMALSFVSKA